MWINKYDFSDQLQKARDAGYKAGRDDWFDRLDREEFAKWKDQRDLYRNQVTKLHEELEAEYAERLLEATDAAYCRGFGDGHALRERQDQEGVSDGVD